MVRRRILLSGGRLAAPDRIGDHQLAQLRLGHARSGCAGENAVSAISEDLDRALLLQRGRGVAQSARQIDDVVDQDAGAPVDIADDVHHFGFARPLAALVDDRQRRVVEPLGETSSPDHAADVGRNHDQLAVAEARVDVGRDDGRGEEIVGRDVEEALDLPGVKIDRQHPVRARGGDEIGDQLGRDRVRGPGFRSCRA